MFDLPRLQKGDVLFTRSKLIGDGIAKATDGRFGHVMLYLDDLIIHADTKGVWSKNPQRILVNDQTRLAAFCPKVALSANHLQRIEDYARSRVGSLYSIPEAAKSRQASTTTGRYILDRQFCSRLVAQSFAEAGINLVVNFDYCTPNEIARSALLQEIPGAVRQADAAEIAFKGTSDFNLELQVETNRWLNRVRSLAERHQLAPIYSQSDVGRWLLDHPKFDAEVCAYIQETRYLTFFDADARNNPWRYSPN